MLRLYHSSPPFGFVGAVVELVNVITPLLSRVIVPFTFNVLLDLSNVKFALPLALPASLNTTCVFDPGAVMLPVILPAKLPIK